MERGKQMKLFNGLKNKVFCFTVLICCLSNRNQAFANDGAAAAAELKKVLTNSSRTGLLDIVQSAGFVILAFGLGQMIMAFKDDNADQKAKGAMVLLAGMFCIIIKTILVKLGAM